MLINFRPHSRVSRTVRSCCIFRTPRYLEPKAYSKLCQRSKKMRRRYIENHCIVIKGSEAVTQSCSVKKAVLRNFAKFTVEHLRHSGVGVSLWILRNFLEHLFYRTPLVAASEGLLRLFQEYSVTFGEIQPCSDMMVITVRHIQSYSALCITLAYSQPCHIQNPRIFRTQDIFKNLSNM